jgi:hypothetical protein
MMRYLIGFADTEGMPQNAKLGSSLWNMYVMFRYTVDVGPERKQPKIAKVLHSAHIAMEQKCGHENVKKPLACHLASLEYIQYITRADKVVVCFWNAPHDRRVITYYGLDVPFQFMDLLPWARKFKYQHDPPIDSFSLKNLVDHFEIEPDQEHSWNKAHTGLGDVLTMMEVIPLVSKFDDEYSLVLSILGLQNPYAMTKSEPTVTKPRTGGDVAKKETVPTSTLRRRCGPHTSKDTPRPKCEPSSDDDSGSAPVVPADDSGDDTTKQQPRAKRRADTVALASELLQKLFV